MILAAILNFVSGGVLRYVPDVLKHFDKRADHAHELAMLDKTYALDKLHADAGLALAQAAAAQAKDSGETELLLAGIRAQAQPSGNAFADALSAMVRPMLTIYWAIILETGALIAGYVVLLRGHVDPFEAILRMWGPDERAIVASIIGFWFADRAIRATRAALASQGK